MEKHYGVLTEWNEVRGYGCVTTRDSQGKRLRWFLHASRIIRIAESSGIPQIGADVWFNQDFSNPRGRMAIDAEIGAVVSRKLEAGLAALRGETQPSDGSQEAK